MAADTSDILVVANKAENTVSLISLDDGSIRATLPTGEGPHEVAVSPDNSLAVVANYGTREEAGSTLTVIDIAKGTVVDTIDLGEFRRPHGMTFLRDSGHMLVTVEENKAVLRVDIEGRRVLSSIGTDQEISHMIATSPDGTRAFVANIRSGSVSVLDLNDGSGELLEVVETGEGAEGVAVTPDGKQVWVTNRAADTISVLDAQSLEEKKLLRASSFPIRAEVTPNGLHVLVSLARSGELAVFSTQSLEEVRRLPMELSAEQTEDRLFGDAFGDSSVPIGIEIAPDGSKAFVAHANADVISVVDLGEWEVVGHLKAGEEPDGMGYATVSSE